MVLQVVSNWIDKEFGWWHIQGMINSIGISVISVIIHVCGFCLDGALLLMVNMCYGIVQNQVFLLYLFCQVSQLIEMIIYV